MSFWKSASPDDRRLLRWSVVCLMLAMLLIGMKDRELRASASEDKEFLRFVDAAAEVYNEIEGKYVDEVEKKKVLEGALVGMFQSLDEHSVYLDPETLESLNKDTGGEFSGIGIHITMRQGLLTVIAPIPGTPAAQLGIAPWDRIIEINGETTEGMNLQDAVEKLTGPKGTTVDVKIYRQGEPDPLNFTIKRDQIKIESVHHTMMEDGIGYIRLARFSENTAADTRRALLDLKSEDMKAMILDLRFNSGGLLREAIDVADLFVSKPEMIVSTKGRLSSQNREYRAEESPIVEGLPIFVLVNEGSASASEIVAGALQDHGIAVVLGPAGQNTFGKGSVQTIEQLRHALTEDADGNSEDAAIKLTTARYYTPSGRTIHQVGITPDIGIPLPENHERELIRHGLYGDTVIPLTKEEKERQEEMQNGGSNDAAPKENGPTSYMIQREEEKRPEATGKTEGDKNEPFYTKAATPEFAEDDQFVDILLEEAKKLMKIYNILENPKATSPSFASKEDAESVSLAD